MLDDDAKFTTIFIRRKCINSNAEKILNINKPFVTLKSIIFSIKKTNLIQNKTTPILSDYHIFILF
jgi:hypothetical protein